MSLSRAQSSLPDAVAPSVLAAQVCAGMLRRSASAASPDCRDSAMRLQHFHAAVAAHSSDEEEL